MSTPAIQGFLLMVALMIVYLFPLVLALFRRHPKMPAIGIINIFLGWTLIGWVICLAWAVSVPNPTSDQVRRTWEDRYGEGVRPKVPPG